MKKILAVLFMFIAIQTAAYADKETDMQEAYITKIQAKGIKYNTYNFFNAISNGDTELVNLFLKAGMSADSTFMKTPAIYMAIAKNQNDVVKLLLENNVDPDKYAIGLTPLIFAIKNKNSAIVATLISYGANVNKEAGSTKPLVYAIKKKQSKIVQQLINAGATPDNEVLLKALKSDDSNITNAVLKRYKTME